MARGAGRGSERWGECFVQAWWEALGWDWVTWASVEGDALCSQDVIQDFIQAFGVHQPSAMFIKVSGFRIVSL